MKKKTIYKLVMLFGLISISQMCFSQYGSSGLLTANKGSIIKKKDNFSIALRGKAFGFFIIEDCYFSTATLGTELIVKGGHSFGLDLTFFGWRYEDDDDEDSPLYETYEKRNYVYLDYKFRFLNLKEYDFYLNLYDKIGLYRFWREGVAEGYNDLETPFLTDKTKGTFNQLGAGIGMKKYYSDRFYIDISANGGKVFTKNNNLIYNKDAKMSVEEHNVKNSKSIFYIRINLGYILAGNYAKKPELMYPLEY